MVLIICRICEKEVDKPTKQNKYCDICLKQKRRDRCKEYKKNNPNVIKSYNKKYKEEHKEETRDYNREYNKKRRESDENFKIRTDNRVKISNIITGYTLYPSFEVNILKCSNKDFIFWIKSNFLKEMCFENYGKLWHIDHVIPVCIFDLTNKEQEKFCFNWKNMRPLYKEKNILKKYSLYDILIHELKIKFFIKEHSDKSFNNINYGVSYLPNQVRNNLMELINC